MPLRKALLGACLALPFAGFASVAHASSTQQERIIRVPPGAVVLILPGSATQRLATNAAVMPALPASFPMLRMMAAQDAMMQQMLRQVRALDQWTVPWLNPGQVIQAALAGMPTQRMAPGTSMVTTMVSDGQGVCRETVTYRLTPNEARPQVHLTRTGNDCGPMTEGGPLSVMQALPARSSRPDAVPASAPRPSQLWTVSDPPRRIAAGTPRT